MITRVESLDALDKPQSVLKDEDKRTASYTVCKKSMGTTLWRVMVDKGPPPNELSGNWTSMKGAENAVEVFLKKSKASHAISENKAIETLRQLRQDKNAPKA